eukprot:COSAG05_NODE_2066_length_3619_cov_2.043466_3_plen_99_part_00
MLYFTVWYICRFGSVIAATLRIRREVKNGKQVVSWALVSFASGAEANEALHAEKELQAVWPALVVRKVDELHAAMSTGAMGGVMKKHLKVPRDSSRTR